MADSVVVTPRQLYVEDMVITTVPTGDTDTVTVLGAAGSQALNKVPIKLLTQLVQAANDAGAAAGGVAIGDCYYSTTTTRLRTRMT
jgi:hypothetical protein